MKQVGHSNCKLNILGNSTCVFIDFLCFNGGEKGPKRVQKGSGDQLTKARWVQGWCKDGAGMVQGWCREGAKGNLQSSSAPRDIKKKI